MLSATQHPEVIDAYLKEECTQGHITGPLDTQEAERVHISRFGVPKPHKPGCWRLIPCCVIAQSVHNSLKTYNFQYSATTQPHSEYTTELTTRNSGTYTALHMHTINQLLSIT